MPISSLLRSGNTARRNVCSSGELFANTVFDLICLKFERQTSRPRDERSTYYPVYSKHFGIKIKHVQVCILFLVATRLVFRKTDELKTDGEKIKKELRKEKKCWKKSKAGQKQRQQEMAEKYNALVKSLEENETHAQLANLEKKWKNLEQNNFAMKVSVILLCHCKRDAF